MGGSGEQLLSSYLRDVRRELRGFAPGEADEVVEELRSHILDRSEGRVEHDTIAAAITALGPPREIAETNIALRAASSLEGGSSPIRVLRTAWLLARLSLRAILVLAASLAGYAIAGGALVIAAFKLVVPAKIGLWRIPDPDPLTFSLGKREVPPGAVELLGWWIVPIAIAIALLATLLTWRFGIASLRSILASWKREEAP
jgi:hypothetical protein